MIKVDDCLVSEDLVEKNFSCNVFACKGACCIEGDSGAPLEKQEIKIIEDHLEKIKPFMDESGLKTLSDQSFYEVDDFHELVTTCKPNKECVFVTRQDGILQCAIEKANEALSFDFPKPISCHLYPVRVAKYGEYYALNYHRWSICVDACVKGNQENTKVYQFAQTALERKFGQDWYKKLEEAATTE